MSLRFRKSISLGGGMKLNLGKKGFSVSAGTRGARITMGTSGTRATVGIPGTGLYYTEKLNTRGMTQRQINAENKRAEKAAQIAMAESEIRDEQREYDRFIKIAKFSPVLLTTKDWEAELVPKPFFPRNYGIIEKTNDEFYLLHLKALTSSASMYKKLFPYCLFGSLALLWYTFSSYDEKVNYTQALALTSFIGLIISSYYGIKWYLAQRKDAHRLADLDFENLRKTIADAKAEHPVMEEHRIQGMKSLMSGDFQILEEQLESEIVAFEEEVLGLRHSFKTEICYEISSPSSISLDVDLPEIEDVAVTEAKKVLKSGKISEKEKSQKVINSEYASGVVGMAFNIASHVFNVSPSITEVIVSGYTQRTNKKTGNVEDEYIYSVKFDRSKFETLNLKEIDPIEALSSFQCNIDLTKAFDFKRVEPLGRKITMAG